MARALWSMLGRRESQYAKRLLHHASLFFSSPCCVTPLSVWIEDSVRLNHISCNPVLFPSPCTKPSWSDPAKSSLLCLQAKLFRSQVCNIVPTLSFIMGGGKMFRADKRLAENKKYCIYLQTGSRLIEQKLRSLSCHSIWRCSFLAYLVKLS